MLVHIPRIDSHSIVLHNLILQLGYESVFGLHLIVMRRFLNFKLLLYVDNRLLQLLSLHRHIIDFASAFLILVTQRLNLNLIILLLVFDFKLFLLQLRIRYLFNILILFDSILLLIDFL